MHRVELKVITTNNKETKHARVPNAPCGVESKEFSEGFGLLVWEVPNAPCGVESLLS